MTTSSTARRRLSMRDVAEAVTRMNKVDNIRSTVLEAVKAEINGHMMATPTTVKLTLGHPMRCATCGDVYMERRHDDDRAGYGFCSELCAEVDKTLPNPFRAAEPAVAPI